MVPGMTERERHAAEMRRLEWLADATLGPSRIGFAPSPSGVAPEKRLVLPIGIWRRGLSSARILGQRLFLLQPGPGTAIPKRALETIR